MIETATKAAFTQKDLDNAGTERILAAQKVLSDTIDRLRAEAKKCPADLDRAAFLAARADSLEWAYRIIGY